MKNIIKAFFAGLSKQEKKILYIAAACVCLALFDRLVIGPISTESKMLDEKISSQVTLTEKNIRLFQYKNKIIDEDNAYNEYFVKEGLTQEELIASFLSEVEGFAKGSGVALTNINPVDTEEKKGYLELSLTVECIGSMKEILTFFYNIDGSSKPIRVASFDMSVKNRESYQAKCAVNITKLIISKADLSEPTQDAEENTLFIKEKLTL